MDWLTLGARVQWQCRALSETPFGFRHCFPKGHSLGFLGVQVSLYTLTQNISKLRTPLNPNNLKNTHTHTHTCTRRGEVCQDRPRLAEAGGGGGGVGCSRVEGIWSGLVGLWELRAEGLGAQGSKGLRLRGFMRFSLLAPHSESSPLSPFPTPYKP